MPDFQWQSNWRFSGKTQFKLKKEKTDFRTLEANSGLMCIEKKKIDPGSTNYTKVHFAHFY